MGGGTAGTVVCVTGGSGYIGSWLVRELLARGCVVHATLRSLADEKKTGLLRALPGAAERLRLFEADIYDADTFEPAIAGCHFVFLVARPLAHDPSSTKYKNRTEATVDAFRIVLQQCERSGTVKRVIHTASVTAASPLKEDGSGYKDFTNESIWTPLKEDGSGYRHCWGSVPLAHVEDVCEAHVFCMEQASMAGRFLCAAGYPNMRDIVDHFAAKHPELKIKLTEVTGEDVRIVSNTSKLEDLGFRFKYGVEETLDCNVECAKRLGEL